MAREENKPLSLQFDRAEHADGAAPLECARCGQPLVSAYFMVNGQPACEACQSQLALEASSGSGSGRFLAALAFGLLAAAAGSAIWYAVRTLTGYEIGLIAVVVGWMVGAAVRAGSRGRGGKLYQALAVGLTYFGICAQYAPDILKAVMEGPPPTEQSAAAGATTGASPAPAASPAATATPDAAAAGAVASDTEPAPTLSGALLALAALLALSLAAPFLGGFENIIGILIIGFALWEAWRMNRRVPLEVEGPYRVGAPPTAAR